MLAQAWDSIAIPTTLSTRAYEQCNFLFYYLVLFFTYFFWFVLLGGGRGKKEQPN